MQTDLFRRNPARPTALTIYDAVLSALDAPTAAVMEQDRTFYLEVIKDALDAKFGPVKAPRIERAPSMGRNTEVGNWLHSSYEGTGEFVVDTAWLGGANEAVARSLVERQLQRDVSKWLDRDKMVVSFEAQERAARIIGQHGDDFADAAFAYFGNGAKPYVYDPKFIEGWLRSIGEVTEPKAPPLVYFASGTNNPSEMEGFALAGQDTGIAVWGKGKRGGRPAWTRTCSGPCFEKIKELGLRFPERRFFMDSGAFSEVDAQDVFKVVLPYTDEMWQQTFERYRDVADVLGPRVYPVMPDRIANEMVTLQRLRKYKDQIADLQSRGASVISVLQSPDLVSAYDNVANIIGPDFIAGIPMKKAPASTEAIVELVQSRPLKGIHLLGIGVQNPRADAILSAIRRAAPSLPITMDSVLIKGAVGRKKTKAGKLPALTAAQDRARRFLGEGGEGLPATSGGAPTSQYQGVQEALREAGIDWTDMISEPELFTTPEQRAEIADSLGFSDEAKANFVSYPGGEVWDEVLLNTIIDDDEDYGDLTLGENPEYQEALENAMGVFLRSDGIIKGAAKLLAAKEVVPEVMAKGGAETLEKFSADVVDAYIALHPQAIRPELTTADETYVVYEFVKGGLYEGGPEWNLKSAGQSGAAIREMEREIYRQATTSTPLAVFTKDVDPQESQELPNAIPFGPKEIVPNDVIWIGNKSKLYVVYRTGVITLKEDALSPYTRKLMAEKGEEIPVLYATALSGGDKGSIVRVFGGKLADLSTQPQTTYFDVPIFYGAPKSVKKRYDAYVKRMTEVGNESLIVPLVESNKKPVEPDAPIPESDASWWDADVRLTHSVDKGTLIEWEDGKEHPQYDEIKAIIMGRGKGFQWSRNLGSWYRPQSVGLLETRVDVGRLVDELHELGLTVHLDLEVSDDVEAAISRKKEHLEQRADMYSERAKKLRTAAGTQADYAQQKAKEAITKMKIPGYFPTPDELAYKMATVAELQPGMEVLEPSAGHGALVDAIQRRVRSVGAGEDPTPAIVDAMEINADLRGLLKEQGIPVVSFDIMHPNDYPIGTYYDRVIMNPPFEKGQSIDHVLKAYGYVKPGGILVALMPESIMYRKDNKHELFRDWMEMENAQIFDVERQKFGRSGEIKTRIVKVKKPRGAKMVAATGKALARQKAARDEARISGGALQASREATRGIPMGQPILRGHHSERKHRKAVEKAERAMERAQELAAKARTAEERARTLSRKGVGAIDVTKGGRTAAAAAPKGYATGPRKKKASPFGLTGAKLKGLVGANKVVKAWGIAPYRAEWDMTWLHPDSPTARGNTRTRLFVNIEQPGERDYFRNRNEVFDGVAFNFSVRERSASWGYMDTDKSKSVTGSIPFDTPTDEAALIIADAIVEMLPQEVLKERGEKKRAALHRKLARARTRQNPALNVRSAVSRADYPGLFGDFDDDGILNIDDPNPYTAGDSEPIEKIRLSDEIGAIIDLRQELEPIRETIMERLQEFAPRATVQGRTKLPFSVINKLRRKRLLHPEKGLTDMVGVAVITDTQQELDALRDTVEAGAFGEVNERESEDFYAEPLNGYRAYHYILTYDDPDLGLLPFELQMKTKRQKALSKLSHLAYKRGQLNARANEQLSRLALRADSGDRIAARTFDEKMRFPQEVIEALTGP